jgi:hypothetical protein
MNLLAWHGNTACFNSSKLMYSGTSIGEGGGRGGTLDSLVKISKNGRDVLLIIEGCASSSLIEIRQLVWIYIRATCMHGGTPLDMDPFTPTQPMLPCCSLCA